MKFTRIEPFMSCLRPELQQSYFATVHQSKASFGFFLVVVFPRFTFNYAFASTD